MGGNLNVPGFHLHFLTADKMGGGHVLQLEMQQGATAWVQEVSRAPQKFVVSPASFGCACPFVRTCFLPEPHNCPSLAGVNFQAGSPTNLCTALHADSCSLFASACLRVSITWCVFAACVLIQSRSTGFK